MIDSLLPENPMDSVDDSACEDDVSVVYTLSAIDNSNHKPIDALTKLMSFIIKEQEQD